MSLIKAIKAQLGLSNTPANNFTITAEADNGTLKLARGNAGATTQDILTVDASGNVLVDGNNLNLFSTKSLAASGYQKLPSELIIQFGGATPPAAGTVAVTWPMAFPNACLIAVCSHAQSSGGNATIYNKTTTGATVFNEDTTSSKAVNYIAIGY